MFPPLDGYEPPEDPLRGVARQIAATSHLKKSFPNLVFVGSGYSYLQEHLPRVAQHAVRTGMGWLADRVSVKHVMLLIYTLIAASVPLLLAGGSRSTMTAFAVLFGLGLGGEYMIIPLMAGQLFGVQILGRVMGIVLTADGVAEATAPMLVGYLRDQSGSYTTGFITLIGTAAAGALAIALLPQRRQIPCESSTAKSSSAVPAGTSSR